MNVMSLGIIGALFYAGMLDGLLFFFFFFIFMFTSQYANRHVDGDGLLAHGGKREYFLQTRYKLLEIIRAPGKSCKDLCQPGKWHQLDER